MPPLRRLCLAAALSAALTGLASAQVELSPDALRSVAVETLAAGQVVDAGRLAEVLLRRDPDDATALMIAAEAALAREDWSEARRLGARAHAEVEGPARFRAARIVALAYAKQDQFSRSQLWLRRAAPDAPDATARSGLQRDYRAVRARNPLSVALSFGIAPSSNVNGGSRNETLTLPGLPFEFALSGDAQALSGVALSGGSALRYRLRSDKASATWGELELSGRTYALSDAAKEQAPDARGSDYSQLALLAGLTHRVHPEGWSGPVEFSARLGRNWYSGEVLADTLGLGVARGFQITPATRFDLELHADRVERHDLESGWWTHSLRTGLRHRLARGDRMDVSASMRTAQTDKADLGYDGAALEAGYDLARPLGPALLSFGVEAEYRDYSRSRFSFDGREDWRGTIEAEIGLPAVERWGFYPEVTVRADRVWSDVDFYDEETLSLELGISSSF